MLLFRTSRRRSSSMQSFLLLVLLAVCSASASAENKTNEESFVSKSVSLHTSYRGNSNTTSCVQGTCDNKNNDGVLLVCDTLQGVCMDENIQTLCGDGPSYETVLIVGNDESPKHIRLRPTGRRMVDVFNIQKAVNQIQSGGLVELCEGEFFLGNRIFFRRIVTISRGMTLQGKYMNGEWKTVIKGGSGLAVFLPDPQIGPFFVKSHEDPNPVIFDGLHLRDWTSEAIFIHGCNGFTFTRSQLTHPVATGLGFPFGITSYIHGVIAMRRTSSGALYMTRSNFDLTRQYGMAQHDSQALSLYGFPPTSFHLIVIEYNTVLTPDEAFELFANDPGEGKTSAVYIRYNDIQVQFDVAGTWIDHFALLLANNRRTDVISIEHNTVQMSDLSLDKHDDVGIFGLTGENFVIRHNNITITGEFKGGVFRIGNVGNLILLDFGMSIVNSLIEDNHFAGTYLGPGFVFTGGRRNQSRGNTFRLGDSFGDASGGEYTIQCAGTNVCGNDWEGNTGMVEGSLGPCEDENRRNLLRGGEETATTRAAAATTTTTETALAATATSEQS